MQKSGIEKKFLIDGFPRNENNLSGWNSSMPEHATVSQVLFFELSEKIMLERIMKRAETSGRDDDNIESATKRFKTFRNETMKVIDHYKDQNIVLTVNADNDIESIYKEVKEGLIL
mmetsp:Transcript_12197/g.10814  ORF Transcript_12197/g.10814 Transcript_12197/m.10814 type:complete len:116 (+) Transcript_12197:273-620(+)